MERRLAAILAADVVGYSRLMGMDEAGILAALKAHRKELIEPKEAQYHGRTIKLMGDGALMEFPSVVEAVTFAVEVQLAMRERNRGVPEERQILYRVGINIGDIIVEDDDIFGDGVNLAARLEGLAEPGGICIRRNVRNQVRDKLDLSFEELGEIEVKNIARPVRAFSIVLDEKAAALVTPVEQVAAQPAATEKRRRWPIAAAVAAVLLLVLGGGIAIWQGGQEPAEQAAAEASILILPFDDLSADASLGYFADGMTEDVITELARWEEIKVVARNSANTYKGKAVDVRQAAADMAVRYVLEGSIRMGGDKLRINAQLIDGSTGHHVWAERFDETGADVLALQDRVTEKIVATLSGSQGEIRDAEHQAAWAKADVALEEYDYYLRGHDVFFRYTPADNARAREIWEEGLAKYPGSGLLRIKIGWTHMVAAIFGWNADRQGALAEAARLVEEGLADDALPAAGHRYGLWLRAYVNLRHWRDYEATIQDAKTAVAAFPYDTEGLFWMGNLLTLSGELALADEWIGRALERDRRPIPNFFFIAGELRCAQGRYDEAVKALLKGLESGAKAYYLAASYAALDRLEEARAAVVKLRETYPYVTPEFIRGSRPFRDEAVHDGLLAQLAKVGWPP